MSIEAKMVFVGDTKVGKTSIMIRYKENEFDYQLNTTIGNMFYQSTVEVNQQQINLSIWDTAGQERYRSLASIHYRDANIIALVYDVTKEENIENLAEWMERIEEHNNLKNLIILVGNKVDLLDEDDSQAWPISDTV